MPLRQNSQIHAATLALERGMDVCVQTLRKGIFFDFECMLSVKIDSEYIFSRFTRSLFLPILGDL